VGSSFSREDAIRGGSLVLLNKALKFKERKDIVSLSVERTIEIACVKLDQLVVLSVYRPPSALYDCFETIMDEALEKIVNTDVEVATAFENFFTDIPVSTTKSLNSSPIAAESILKEHTKQYTSQFKFKKLHHYGFRDTTLDLIVSYLSDRVQGVDINGVKSPGSSVKMGVPQGSILGPFLFLIYINDLPYFVKDNHEIVLFADDTSLLFKTKRRESQIDDVNRSISKVVHWFNVNNKTNVNIKDRHMSSVDTTVFLGITVDSKLQWGPHIDGLSKRLSSAAYAVMKIRQLTDIETARLVYFSYFHSVMSYGILLWGNAADIQTIFVLQKRAIRSIYNLKVKDSLRDKFKEIENNSNADMESEVNVEKDDFKLPWAVYNDHVKVIKIKKKENNVTSYDVKCVHCQKTLTIDDRSTSNLRKHLSSFHLSILKQIDQESKNHKGKKRKHDESNSSNFKQLSIENATGKHISQDKLDKMVLDCIKEYRTFLPFDE
ncbi:hypothetical protein evm_014186, partial [Chilo suppressalis]